MSKIETLENARTTLKNEFVGLDSIIDKIILSVTPWYVTPEIIKRPVIVSLWGMTGTGKTSVVTRLLELLDLKSSSMFVDCGKMSGEGTESIGGKISDFFNLDNSEVNTDSLLERLVFVLDEFQYARTIDEAGCEYEDKSGVRPIWSLLDTGILGLNENNYETSIVLNFIEDFLGFAQENKTVKIKDAKVMDKDDVKKLLDSLGYFYYDRGIPGLTECPKEPWEYEESKPKEKEDPYRPIDIIERRVLRVLINRLKAIDNTKKPIDYIKEINALSTVGELAEYLKNCRKLFTTPRNINCSKSLVFVLGNLDEAFVNSDDLTPDVDADIFYRETENVSVADIKNALLKRFKPEQIARIGNNIIKYPSLKKKDFMEIIKREVEKSCDDFKGISGIRVTVNPKVIDLIYSEGVYPVQGVRPLFTTIGTIFTPIFSDIIRSGSKDDVEINVLESDFNIDKVTLTYGTGTKEIELELGKLRNPRNRKLRYATATHEVGHAVVMSYLTGEIPSAIIAVDSQRGGVTVSYNEEMATEIDTKADMENDVCISLGGYYAEEVIFQKQSKMLLGSGSDLDSAWHRISDAVFKYGYFEPVALTERRVEDTGMLGVPGGFDYKENYNVSTECLYRQLEERTKKIISDNVELIKRIALDLAQTGKMSGQEYQKYIEENKSGTLNSKRLKEAKEECDYRFYERKLRGEI